MTKEAPTTDAPRLPLGLKLASLTTVLAILPVPVVGFFLLSSAQAALEDQLRELQLAVADEVTAGVEHEMTSARDGLETLSGILVDDRLGEDETVAAARRIVEGEESIDHCAIYDVHGGLIDRVREAAAEGASSPETLPEALRAEALEHGVATEQTATDGRLLVLVPLRFDGEPTGFVGAPVSLIGVRERVDRIASHRFGEVEDTVAVVDAEGRPIAGPDHSWNAHPLLQELHGERFVTTFAHQRIYEDREERIGTLVSMRERRWGVIVQIPTRIAFAPIREMRTWVGVTVAVVTILALVLGLMVARSITAPIRVLTDFARRLGRRELGHTVRIDTRDELRVLGDALSGASIDLKESEDRILKEEAIRSDLGRYVSPEIVDRVVAREQDMRLGGTREQITVLFADVVAFTPLTEEKGPEEVVAILNELFTILTEIVFRHEGTIDKFIGDCVMAIWGAPSPTEEHASRALEAAEDMLAWLEAGNVAWKEKHGVEIRLAIGIHSGEAVVGNVGSESRMAYTAIGDVVNVAARLEAIARPQQVLITAATRDAAGEAFEYGDLGERTLSGRREPIHLYEVRM